MLKCSLKNWHEEKWVACFLPSDVLLNEVTCANFSLCWGITSPATTAPFLPAFRVAYVFTADNRRWMLVRECQICKPDPNNATSGNHLKRPIGLMNVLFSIHLLTFTCRHFLLRFSTIIYRRSHSEPSMLSSSSPYFGDRQGLLSG